MPRGNAFVGTLNFADEDLAAGEERFEYTHQFVARVFSQTWCCFYAGQVEEGDKEGRTHIQFFFHTNKRVDFKFVNKKLFNRAHLEVQRGSNDHNFNYCCSWTNPDKPSARYQICHGEPITEDLQNKKAQGQRSDLSRAVRKAIEVGSVEPLWRESPGLMVQYGRGMREAVAWSLRSKQTESRPIEVLIYYGVAGSGKSHAARAFGDYYVVQDVVKGQNRWFDGYTSQSTIIFEEFDWRLWPIQVMNRLTDKWSTDVKICGGFTPALWTRVIICANIPPQSWWPSADKRLLSAFIRRVTSVEEFTKSVITLPAWPATRKRKPKST